MKIAMKVGKDILNISESDVIMDNGSIIQFITRQSGSGYHTYPTKMSKKLFNSLVKNGGLYTNEELELYAKNHYIVPVTLYKFNLPLLNEQGYERVE